MKESNDKDKKLECAMCGQEKKSGYMVAKRFICDSCLSVKNHFVQEQLEECGVGIEREEVLYFFVGINCIGNSYENGTEIIDELANRISEIERIYEEQDE